MEIQEALNTLDQVCAGYQGTRADHVALQQSMQVVTAALKLKPTGVGGSKKKDPKKEPDGNN